MPTKVARNNLRSILSERIGTIAAPPMRGTLTNLYKRSTLNTPNTPRLARGGCIYCRGGPTVANLSLCSRCHLFLADFGPLLLPLPKDHDTYWNGEFCNLTAVALGRSSLWRRIVHNQFINSWAHPTGGGRAEVRMVYRILPARGVWSNFWTYQ